MSGDAVTAHDLTRVFRSGFLARRTVRALDGVTLGVPPGSVFALLGPNGSGKTTFLKLVLGLLRPTAGSLAVLGADPGSPAALARTGYMAEIPAFLPMLTGEETLLLAGRLAGLDRAARARRAAALLERVDLVEAARRPVGHYSQGMRKRVALAQSLVNDPALLLLDEPTAGLDPASAAAVQELVRERAARGLTVVLSSHLLARVEEVADAVAILHEGRVVRTGSLDSVAGLPGTLDLRIRGGDDRLAVEALRAAGFETLSCKPAARSLEDVFLDLTGSARPDTERGAPAVEGRPDPGPGTAPEDAP